MRVVVAADRPIILGGLRHALGRELPDPIIRTASSATKCLELVQGWAPHLVVVDAQLQPQELVQLAETLHGCHARSVFVTGKATEALDLVQAHADGVVAHRDGLQGVVRACRTVLEGKTYVTPTLLGKLLEGLVQRQRGTTPARPSVERLSYRERQVFELLGAGRDQTEIARALDIAPQTAKTHIRHVLTKLGVRSRVEAGALAVEMNFRAEAPEHAHVDG